MRVNSVQTYYPSVYRRDRNRSSVNESNNITTSNTSRIRHLSFTGNMWQLASLTPENNGLGLDEAKQGGEGVVGYEFPKSLNEHEKVKVKLANGGFEEKPVDARSFMPFWEYNNPKGGFKFLIHKGIKRSQLKPPAEAEVKGSKVKAKYDTMPATMFYSADVGEDISAVAKKFGVPLDEISYVIQSKPDSVGPNAKSKYCIIEPTSIKGKVTRLSEKVLGETEDIPYVLFKISDINPTYNKLKNKPNYFIYTPQLARASKPYAYDAFGNVPFEAEISNSDGVRALAETIHNRMDTKEFGNFKPASVVCHDRIYNTYGNHIANMSADGKTYVNGLKVHIVDHNTGFNYQGRTDDPFKYQVVVGDAKDAEVMKGLPDFPILQKAKQYGINSDMLSPRERQIAHAIMDPYLANFRDGLGTYNILEAGISAARLNPDNISVGTVSYTFDKEMRSKDTYDAAKFLTDDFARIQTKSVLNGATPASLKLNDPSADFGDYNGLTAAKDGFTTFEYNTQKGNINDIITAREKNSKWFTDLVWEAGQKGQDELNKLFFNEAQIADGHNVVGYFSPAKKGDIIIMGWGRADEQKGFNITVKGFLEFLKRKDVPKELKQRVKLIIGGGPWNKGEPDYKSIMSDYKIISELDGGAYKHNMMFVDGRISNRLVACAQYGIFTSRREMCGITPLEAKIAGVPYGVTKTGGPVDYTNSLNGFMTKEPVELNPEFYGLSWNNTKEEIDAARVQRQSCQVSDIYKAMIEEYTNNYDSYVAKCKKNIEELVDWHNNAEYNHGKSANRRYLDDIFEVNKGWEARNKATLNRVVGPFGEFKEELETMMTQTKSKPLKMILAIAVGAVAVAGGLYLFVSKKKEQTSLEVNAKVPDDRNDKAKDDVKKAA